MSVGLNTESGQLLGRCIERIETIRAEKKQLSESESAVMAEAKAAGFLPSAIRTVVKYRAMKPHDLQEAEALVDTYRHALGMTMDTPLFRQVGLMSIDKASRDEVIEALKKFVPENGSITIEASGRPVRLTRDKAGEVTASEIVPAAPRPVATEGAVSRPERPPVPDVAPEAAEILGVEAFGQNTPIIANPFPFGDARRPRWDAGWRKASGGDGMGPGGN